MILFLSGGVKNESERKIAMMAGLDKNSACVPWDFNDMKHDGHQLAKRAIRRLHSKMEGGRKLLLHMCIDS